jgi:hypothetical protein
MIQLPSKGNGGGAAPLVARIASEFEAALGSPSRVAEACEALRGTVPAKSRPAVGEELAPLLSRRSGALAAPLFELLLAWSREAADPAPPLTSLLGARDVPLRERALGAATELAREGRLSCRPSLLVPLAAWVEEERAPRPAAASDLLEKISCLIGGFREAESLFRSGDTETLRRLGARLLDRSGEPAAPEWAAALLGPATAAALAPLFAFTRASHEDLHALREAGGAEKLAADVAAAREACGADLLARIVAAIGWPRLALGLEVRPRVGVQVHGSFPYLLAPEEAELLQGQRGVQVLGRRYLVVAIGAEAPGAAAADPGTGRTDRIDRFRVLNRLHAEVLRALLDMAPLTPERARAILDRMDRIVSEYVDLFAAADPEARALARIYGEMRASVDPDALDAASIRRIQMFEDPASLPAVRTFHGLKRLLHQRGLRLGFQWIGSAKGTNRTAGLLVASESEVLREAHVIRYADFEEEAADAGATEPPPIVALAIEAFLPILAQDAGRLPEARFFCYGNEVHGYFTFAAHPAWLRVDLAPPLHGGMVDLEYYGVSKVDLERHPAIDLPAAREFLRRRELDVEVAQTRVRARYDKERGLDLGDLRSHTEALLRLVPYLMDLDWQIASLRYDPSTRARVVAAWSDFHAAWGFLPLARLTTRDGRSVVCGHFFDAAGRREERWDGAGPYRDLFTHAGTPSIVALLEDALRQRGIERPPGWAEAPERAVGQDELEKRWLAPLRQARRSGALEPGKAHPWAHEAEVFAAILTQGGAWLESAERTGALLAPLERTLRFLTTGEVAGLETACATLVLWSRTMLLHVLRDAEGMIRLGFFTLGLRPVARADSAGSTTFEDASVDAADLTNRLRKAQLLAEDAASSWPAAAGAVERFGGLSRAGAGAATAARARSGRVLTGISASPGRVVGRILFTSLALRRRGAVPSSVPGSVSGSVLWVAPALRAEDADLLREAAGIVGTGGGILSHLGLLASQLGKPALILSGTWGESRPGEPVLLCPRRHVEVESARSSGLPVTLFRRITETTEAVREGDWAVLDAGESSLILLGAHPDVGAFFEELRQLREVHAELETATDDGEVLDLRGRRLRLLHRLERLVAGLTDPDLAREISATLAGPGATKPERSLLPILLASSIVGEGARAALEEEARALDRRIRESSERSRERLAGTASFHEILLLRSEAARLAEHRARVGGALGDAHAPEPPAEIEERAARALEAMREGIERAVTRTGWQDPPVPALRHQVRSLERLASVLPAADRTEAVAGIARRLAEADASRLRELGERHVLPAAACGGELADLVGGKAANLGELARLLGGEPTPPWFSVTDRALQEILDAPLRERLAEILRAHEETAAMAARIRELFAATLLPAPLVEEVRAAFRAIAPDGAAVSVRSSGREEDTEEHAAAGEFESFLFVRGEEELLRAMRRGWAGYWTARAIHRRMAVGIDPLAVHGGLVVQRMAVVRVSGVLLTAHMAAGRMDEMVVNAGLGLGEGIVSGEAEADHILIARAGIAEGSPLRFRYRTGEKRTKVVPAGQGGTMRIEALAHERLRPALEYRELEELVRCADRLETSWGLPLDLEFGYEEDRLWILQARPIALCATLLQEAIGRGPLLPRRAAEKQAAKRGLP